MQLKKQISNQVESLKGEPYQAGRLRIIEGKVQDKIREAGKELGVGDVVANYAKMSDDTKALGNVLSSESGKEGAINVLEALSKKVPDAALEQSIMDTLGDQAYKQLKDKVNDISVKRMLVTDAPMSREVAEDLSAKTGLVAQIMAYGLGYKAAVALAARWLMKGFAKKGVEGQRELLAQRALEYGKRNVGPVITSKESTFSKYAPAVAASLKETKDNE